MNTALSETLTDLSYALADRCSVQKSGMMPSAGNICDLANEALDTLASARAERHGETFAKASAHVLQTPLGSNLYGLTRADILDMSPLAQSEEAEDVAKVLRRLASVSGTSA